MHIADEKLMLSLRVGNVRSKTFLNPSARLVLAMEVEEHHQHTHHPEDGKPLCLVVRPSPPFSHFGEATHDQCILELLPCCA